MSSIDQMIDMPAADIIATIEGLPSLKPYTWPLNDADDMCRSAMYAALWQWWPAADFERLVRASAKAMGCTREIARETCGEVFMNTYFNAPKPAWVAEINKELTLINGEFYWVTPGAEAGAKDSRRPASSASLRDRFAGQFINIFSPRSCRVIRLRADRAWVRNTHRREGR